MIANLFRPRQRSRPERPTFRPVLESLERRDVPSAAQVSAAFDALPGDINNLEASLRARDVNGINNNLATVSNDMFLLKLGASGFVVGDRLRIDATLLADGVRLAIDGFTNIAFTPPQLTTNIIQVGFDAGVQGFTDILVTDFFPDSSGNSTLT